MVAATVLPSLALAQRAPLVAAAVLLPLPLATPLGAGHHLGDVEWAHVCVCPRKYTSRGAAEASPTTAAACAVLTAPSPGEAVATALVVSVALARAAVSRGPHASIAKAACDAASFTGSLTRR